MSTVAHKKSRAVSRAALALSQARVTVEDVVSDWQTGLDSSKWMGVFVNQRNLRRALESTYATSGAEAGASVVSAQPSLASGSSPKSARSRSKRNEEAHLATGKFSFAAKPNAFLHNIKWNDDDPLTGYTFENAEPADLVEGVRLTASTARSELSSHETRLPRQISSRRRLSSLAKASVSTSHLAGPNTLPKIMHHLIGNIVRGELTIEEIIRTSCAIITEHGDVDTIHLHVRDKGDDVILIKSVCSSQFVYNLPPKKPHFCTPFTSAFWTGNMIVANYVMADARWDKDNLFYEPNISHAIALPIFSITGGIFAVIELLRHRGRPGYDDKVIRLIFSTMQSMQSILLLREKVIVEHSVTAYALLSRKLAELMLSQVKDTEVIITTIMTHAKQLVQAEKVALFTVDGEKQELATYVLDRGNHQQMNFKTVDPIRIPFNVGVCGHVARTGEYVVDNNNLLGGKPYQYEGIFEDELRVSNMLTVPLKVKKTVIGVLQILNKVEGVFEENDLENIKDYCTFCGLTLHISKMYDKMFRSEQKCRITMEIMLHHNLVTDNEIREYSNRNVPENIPGILEPVFSPWHMPDEDMPLVFIYMVHDIIGESVVDIETLIRFTLTVRKNYRDVIYHNWYHGFSVAHATYVQIKRDECKFTQVEKLCLLIAALCHDLDHRGTDNSFQRKKGTPLATLYSTSIMEHHHFNMTVTILQQPGNQIFAHVTGTSYYESNFYKYVCLPLFRLQAQVLPSLSDIPNQAFANFTKWSDMCLLPDTIKHERVVEMIQRSRKGPHISTVASN